MTNAAITTRFAPSPTGYTHLGNLRTALFNALLARAGGGRFLLRSEDTDRDRSAEEFLDALCEDLRWLGLDWDLGPDSPEEANNGGPFRQSERGAIYRRYFDQLTEKVWPILVFAAANSLNILAGPGSARARRHAIKGPVANSTQRIFKKGLPKGSDRR